MGISNDTFFEFRWESSTRDSYPRGKAAGAWCWSITSI